MNVEPGKSIVVENLYESESEGLNNEIAANTDTDYQAGDFVLFEYEGEKFPGCVIKVENTQILIKSMQRSGIFNWRWPTRPDIMFYNNDQVIMKIPEPQGSSRGIYKVPQLENKYVE
jgi:hypothetical protein